MDDAQVDIHELTDLQERLFKIAIKLFPDEVKKFLKQNAKEVQNVAKRIAKQEVKKDTGNYLKGFKVSKSYVGNGRGYIKMYNSQPHAHLIEYGHKKWINGKNTGEYVPGRFVIQKASVEFISKYYTNAQKFLEEYFDEAIQ